VAAYHQIKSLGIDLTPTGLTAVMSLLIPLWADHGDAIANQYAGSGAMHRVDDGGFDFTRTPYYHDLTNSKTKYS
jgi:hypothetical protein